MLEAVLPNTPETTLVSRSTSNSIVTVLSITGNMLSVPLPYQYTHDVIPPPCTVVVLQASSYHTC